MHCHCSTSNRAPRWTFTDPCKPEVRPGAWEESASPGWLAASAINARDKTKVYIWCSTPVFGTTRSLLMYTWTRWTRLRNLHTKRCENCERQERREETGKKIKFSALYAQPPGFKNSIYLRVCIRDSKAWLWQVSNKIVLYKSFEGLLGFT